MEIVLTKWVVEFHNIKYKFKMTQLTVNTLGQIEIVKCVIEMEVFNTLQTIQFKMLTRFLEYIRCR